MAGDNNGKWFVAGGRSRAKKRKDSSSSGRGTSAGVTGASTSCSGEKKCFNCWGVSNLQHQCPSRAGATKSHGKQAARGQYCGDCPRVQTHSERRSRSYDERV